jgi:hypothetical protein
VASLPQNFAFQLPEFVLAVLFEDFVDGLTAELNYLIVGIYEYPVQAFGYSLSND